MVNVQRVAHDSQPKLPHSSDTYDMFSKMSGKGYIILNVLRAFNIVSLITVVVASWVMLVRTVQTSNV